MMLWLNQIFHRENWKFIPSASVQNYWDYFYRYYLSQARPIAKTTISEGADKKGAAAAEDDSKVYVHMISTQVSRISRWEAWLAKFVLYKLKICVRETIWMITFLAWVWIWVLGKR